MARWGSTPGVRAEGPLGWIQGQVELGEGTGGALEGPWPGVDWGAPLGMRVGILLIQMFVPLLRM